MSEVFDAYERELWDGRADAYERGFARVTRHTIGPLLDAAGVVAGARVLDVGTGPGFVAAEAAERGARVAAVDAEPGMARVAARNAPGAAVRVAVLPELPFPDGAFDAVVGNFVINHVGDPVRALRELRRVLAPSGTLALTCWAMPGTGVLAMVRDALDAAGVPWPDDVPDPPFLQHGTPPAFRALLEQVGFSADVTELDWDHVVDPREWWTDGALARVGANGVVVGRLDDAALARVKTEYDRLAARHATADGNIALPAHALLARATPLSARVAAEGPVTSDA